MDTLIQPLITWIGANPQWAYLIVFLAALAESIAVAGMIVPGVMLMFGAGALIATGDLGFWTTATVAIIGAILGDNLSFWIGRRYRHHLRSSWPLRHARRQLDQGISFFDRYGAKSVAIGRFFGPVRAVIPLVAGMLQMPPRRFAIANALSAIAWAPAYLLPGIVFGASIKLAAEAAARLAILLVLLIGLIWLAAWVARQLFFRISPHASAWTQALLRWGNLHPVLGRIALDLADPEHPEAKTLAALAVVLIGATAVLGITLSIGLLGAQQLMVNAFALDLGQSLHSPLADQIMIAFSRLGALLVTVPLVVAILIFLELNHQRRALLYWLAALGFAFLVTPLLGWLIRLPRPVLGLDSSWPWSFPSGPLLSATVLYGFLAIALSQRMPSARRWIPYAAAATLISAVFSARLYLGAEWLTDLLATIALGLAWIALLGLAFLRHIAAPPHGSGLTRVTLLAGGIAFAAATWTEQSADLARYKPQPDWTSVSMRQWTQGDPLPVAKQREDLWQLNQRPFDVQYAGPLAELRSTLVAQGWTPANLLSWGNAIRLLSPSLPLKDLPVVPHVHDGRHDDLTLVKDLDNGQRLVLRLWDSFCRIDAVLPLYVGDLTALRKDVILKLIALPLTEPAPSRGRGVLRSDLARAPGLTVGGQVPLRITAANAIPFSPVQPAATGLHRPSAGTTDAQPQDGPAPARP